MGVFQVSTGMPGIGVEKLAKQRQVSADGYFEYLPGGRQIDSANTRDPGNDDPTRLRPGLVLGQITSSSLYANSVIGNTTGALANAGTTITIAAAEAAELVRRIGSSGTMTLTGPPTAGGPVRSVTVTYSAVNTSTGVVTITSPTVNEVQTVTVAGTLSAGTVALTFVDKNNVEQTVDVAYNASAATIQTAINGALGTSAVAVAGTMASFTITYSGTGYTGLPQTLVQVDASSATGATGGTATRTTAGVSGAFVAGSFVQPTDGSQTPVWFLPDGWEYALPTDLVSMLPVDRIPVRGNIDGTKLLPWPADASLKQWVRNSLNNLGRFVFTEQY